MPESARSGGSSQASASDRYGLLRRPARLPDFEDETLTPLSPSLAAASASHSAPRENLRPRTAHSRVPRVPLGGGGPIVGGSAGRLRELSQQRPMSAGGGGGRAEAAQTGKASGAADSERSRSIDLSDMSVGDGYSDNSQKSSFYAAVREYERNLSSLRKERDDLLVCVCVCVCVCVR